MFKISLLSSTSGKSDGTQPTKSSQQERRSRQQQPPSPAKQPLSSALEPRDWTQQAADVTDGLLDASKYKSLAVYAEVKLAEALDKASKVQPDTVNGDGEMLPNSLKTAVCFQLLGELAELCGPFSKTLLGLRDQLLPAVYSSYAAAQATRPLQFDQMPWFSVAAHLQRDNTALLAQQEAFKRELAQHQVQMAAVEQQLLTFKKAIDASEAAAAALTATNAGLVAARNAAVDDATAAAEEAKRLAAQVARLKEELNELHDQLNNCKDNAAQDKDEWLANLAVLKKQLVIEQQEKESAVAMAAARLTAAEAEELEQRCSEAERKLEEAEQRLADAANTAQRGDLTPRPMDWGPDQELADRCKSTAEAVKQLQQQHLETITALQRQLNHLKALNQPDPAPKPWILSLRTETSAYFITEGALNPSSTLDYEGSTLGANPNAKPKLFAEGLGLSSRVPRFLRWDEAVEIQECGLEDLQQQIKDIRSGREQYQAVHGPCGFQEYLYHHFAASAAAAVQEASSSAGTADPVATAAAAVEAGYSFYHAVSSHRQKSAVVDGVWHVLTGQLPEGIFVEQQQQVTAVAQLMEELSSSVEQGQGVAAADVASALRFLYPLKPQEQLAELSAHITAACGGTSRSASSSGRRAFDESGSNSSGSMISREFLQQAVRAVKTAAGKTLVTTSSAGVAELEQQQMQSANLQEGELGAEAMQLLDCLLRQHLQAVVAQTKEVMQRVQELLAQSGTAATASGDVLAADGAEASSSSSSSSSSDAAWQQVAAYLMQVVGHSSNSSTRSLAAAGGGSSNSRLAGSMRYRAAAADAVVHDMPLVAAAAAQTAAEPQQTMQSGLGALGSSHGDNVIKVEDWLRKAQQLSLKHGLLVEQIVEWLQRDCLFTPGSCVSDIAAARQWCGTVLRGKHATARGS